MTDQESWIDNKINRRTMIRGAGLAGAGLAGAALIGCSDDDDEDASAPAASASGPKKGGVLILADVDTPEVHAGATGPYAIGRGDMSEEWAIGLHDSLMKRRDSLELEPRLAESWEQNGDATATMVKLREGITFHDGKPIDAAAVKASFEAMQDVDRTNSSQVRGLAKTYLDSIEINDSRNLTFNHPRWPGQIIFDFFHFGVIHDADDFPAYQAMESKNGSGPFKWDWDQYKTGESYVVVPHENHYAQPLLDAIEVRTVPDEDTRALALENGEIHGATVSADMYQRLGAMDGLQKHLGPSTAYWVIGLVQTHLGGGHPANDDARFRLAVHKAIDRARLHTDVYAGVGKPTYQMWPTSSAAYDAAFDKDPWDPEGARKLIQEGGYDGLEMDIFASTNVPDNAALEIIQSNLKDIGVNLNIKKIEIGDWVDGFLAGQHPGAYAAGTGFFWCAPETLPNMNFQFRFPENAVASVTGEYKRIVDAFGAQPTPEQTKTLYNDWNELWASGPWLHPFHSHSATWILSDKVKAAVPHPSMVYDFKEEWWLDV